MANTVHSLKLAKNDKELDEYYRRGRTEWAQYVEKGKGLLQEHQDKAQDVYYYGLSQEDAAKLTKYIEGPDLTLDELENLIDGRVSGRMKLPWKKLP